MNTATTDPEAGEQTRPRSFHRAAHDRMLAGVAAGIADYLDVDVTMVRMVIAVLAVFGGAGLAVYIAGWLLIPDEGADESIAAEFIRNHTGCSS